MNFSNIILIAKFGNQNIVEHPEKIPIQLSVAECGIHKSAFSSLHESPRHIHTHTRTHKEDLILEMQKENSRNSSKRWQITLLWSCPATLYLRIFKFKVACDTW